jgi:hypothetical protein
VNPGLSRRLGRPARGGQTTRDDLGWCSAEHHLTLKSSGVGTPSPGIHYEVWFERGPCPAALNRISGPLIDVRLAGKAGLIGNGGDGGNAGTGNSPGSPGPGGNPGLLLGQNGMNGLT